MNKLSSITLAALLATVGSGAFAAPEVDASLPPPTEMSDAQMDKVAAGIANFNNLVAVDVNNVLSNNDVQVAVPVNAAVAVGAVGILSRQTGILADATAPGRTGQRQ